MDNSINSVSFGMKFETKMQGRNGVLKAIKEKFEAKTANIPGTLMLNRGNNSLGENPEAKYFQLNDSNNQMFLDCDEFLATKTGKHTVKQQNKLVNKLIRIVQILKLSEKADSESVDFSDAIGHKVKLRREHNFLANTAKTDSMRNRFNVLANIDNKAIKELKAKKETAWKQNIDKMYKIAKNDKDIANDYIAAIDSIEDGNF